MGIQLNLSRTAPPSLSTLPKCSQEGKNKSNRNQTWRSLSQGKKDLVPGSLDCCPRTDRDEEISISEIPMYTEDIDHEPDSHMPHLRHGSLDVSEMR